MPLDLSKRVLEKERPSRLGFKIRASNLEPIDEGVNTSTKSPSPSMEESKVHSGKELTMSQ